MTAAPQPLERLTTVLDHTIRAIAWIAQAGAATAYLIIVLRPSAWQSMLDVNPVGVACTWIFTVGMTAIWAISLWGEQQRFYDRFVQRNCRKFGLIGHLSVLFIAAAAVSPSPARIGWWVVLGMLCFCAVATWGSWMAARFLPDEDQAVVDEIIHREAAQRAAIHDAGEREKRRQRLTTIVESLGYTLASPPARADDPTDAPTVRWTIPAGKHAPLVYFIRNGNRMKIGTTTDLKRRIRTLALRQENVTLLVNGDHRRERAFHKQFADLRIGRTEWFAYEGALTDYVHDQITQKGRQQ